MRECTHLLDDQRRKDDRALWDMFEKYRLERGNWLERMSKGLERLPIWDL